MSLPPHLEGTSVSGCIPSKHQENSTSRVLKSRPPVGRCLVMDTCLRASFVQISVIDTHLPLPTGLLHHYHVGDPGGVDDFSNEPRFSKLGYLRPYRCATGFACDKSASQWPMKFRFILGMSAGLQAKRSVLASRTRSNSFLISQLEASSILAVRNRSALTVIVVKGSPKVGRFSSNSALGSRSISPYS